MSHNSPRCLVLCFDGTSNEFDDTNTNVVNLCAALKMDDRAKQMVYYQPGIGTWTAPNLRGRVERWIGKTADLAIAWYLSAHIAGGYEFLMDNHLPGDKICIFGFSRGAYTARALAGMLHSVGLLPKGNQEQVPFAYRIYKKNSPLAPKFKNTFSKSVSIDFLGVWDTVASVGLIIPKTLPFVSNNTVRIFRHAVSLDEHRTKFGVTLWKPGQEVTDQEHPDDFGDDHNSSVEEMWFAGTHGDVGGGNVKDGQDPNLANISFRWILHEVYKADCGVLFDPEGLDALKVPFDCVPRGSSVSRLRVSSEDTAIGEEDSGKMKSIDKGPFLSWKEADEQDLVAPMHDQLKLQPLWWLIQVPVWTGVRIDFAGQRRYPLDATRQTHSNIHWTAMVRMEKVKGYVPKARLPLDWQASEVIMPSD